MTGELLLAPTAEEEITRIVAETVFTHKRLPLMLYQIGPKFRKEARPKGGLLRMCEFLMKDLYCFDKDLDSAIQTYKKVVACYQNIFSRLEMPVITCKAPTGLMGGIDSQEFHLISSVGEDQILLCESCGGFRNPEIHAPCCLRPLLKEVRGLELGHAFLLGDKYSRPLDGIFTDADMARKHYQMGCYGIGISRLLAAIAEINNDNHGLKWPCQVAPFRATIVTEGSFNEGEILSLASIFHKNSEVLVDDRADVSIIRKLRDHYLIGVPVILVLGRHWRENKLIECHMRREKKREVLSFYDLSLALPAIQLS